MTIELLFQKYTLLDGSVGEEQEAIIVPLSAWETGDVVRLIELLDSELQRRYDEQDGLCGCS